MGIWTEAARTRTLTATRSERWRPRNLDGLPARRCERSTVAESSRSRSPELSDADPRRLPRRNHYQEDPGIQSRCGEGLGVRTHAGRPDSRIRTLDVILGHVVDRWESSRAPDRDVHPRAGRRDAAGARTPTGPARAATNPPDRACACRRSGCAPAPGARAARLTFCGTTSGGLGVGRVAPPVIGPGVPSATNHRRPGHDQRPIQASAGAAPERAVRGKRSSNSPDLRLPRPAVVADRIAAYRDIVNNVSGITPCGRSGGGRYGEYSA